MKPSSELLQLRVVWGCPSDLQSVLEVMTVLGTIPLDLVVGLILGTLL